MATIVEFIDTVTVKVVTSRGEELLGYLMIRPAMTEEERQLVIENVKQAFDMSNNLAEVNNYFSICPEILLMGMTFKYTVKPSEALRKKIGMRLRELREAKGWSVREAAFMTKMDPSNYSRIELGKHAPSIDTLNKIAFYLDAELQILPREDMNPRDKYTRVYSYE